MDLASNVPGPKHCNAVTGVVSSVVFVMQPMVIIGLMNGIRPMRLSPATTSRHFVRSAMTSPHTFVASTKQVEAFFNYFHS